MKLNLKKVALIGLLSLTLSFTALAPTSSIQAGIIHTNQNSSQSFNIWNSINNNEKTTAEQMNSKYVAETYTYVKAGKACLYTNAAQLARFVQTNYASTQPNGPFSITEATLNSNTPSKAKKVYVIALSGTDMNNTNQTTDIETDIKVGLEQDNKYLENVRKTMLAMIPSNANVILTGHSLGGMIAQQLAGDSIIKANYNVLNTITYGSPLIKGSGREGVVKQLADKKDPVPYCSVSTIWNFFTKEFQIDKEDGGYKDGTVAHVCSYQREDVWGGYDVTGQKNGQNHIIMDYSTTRYYHSLKSEA